MEKNIQTLALLVEDKKILLGMKKRGFGAGRWNGFGGKVEVGETIEEAVVREIREEAGINAQKIEKRGVLRFHNEIKNGIIEGHIYKVLEYSGEPTESEEMKPEWFDLDKIPYDSMWSDDRYWLPLFLEDKKFEGEFHFDADGGVASCRLDEIKQLW